MQKKVEVIIMLALLAGVLIVLSLSTHAAAAYLEHEVLSPDLTGTREVKTTLPLEASKEYLVKLRSPHYDLLPVWGHLASCRCMQYLLRIDGQPPSDKDRVSPWRSPIKEVIWRWYGRGAPLSLRFAKDMTQDLHGWVIRHATIEVSRVKDPVPAPAPPPPAAPPAPLPPLIVSTEPTPAGDVLAKVRFPLPVNGRGFKTDLPLEAGRLMHIKIHSPHNLHPLWNTRRGHFRVHLDGRPLRHDALVTLWDHVSLQPYSDRPALPVLPARARALVRPNC